METNLKKGTKLKSILFSDSSEYTVGKSCIDITVVMEHGQMAYVPWFLVKVNDDITVQVNAAQVKSVVLDE